MLFVIGCYGLKRCNKQLRQPSRARTSRMLHSFVSFVFAFISKSSLFLSGVLPGKMILLDILYSFFSDRVISGNGLLLFFLGNLHLGYDRFNHVGGEGFARFGEGSCAQGRGTFVAKENSTAQLRGGSSAALPQISFPQATADLSEHLWEQAPQAECRRSNLSGRLPTDTSKHRMFRAF